MSTLKHPQQVTLFTRPMCSWCNDAKAWLDTHGWQYNVCNVGTSAVAQKRALALSGQGCVPVIEVDGLVLGDFDTLQLEAFLAKHGYLEQSLPSA